MFFHHNNRTTGATNDCQSTYQFSPIGEVQLLTKRELFAAMAMQGFCAGSDKDGLTYTQMDVVAADAVVMADALIAALNQPQETQP